MSDDLVRRLRAIDKDIILRRFDPEMSFDGMTAHEAADRIEKLEQERDNAKYLLQQYFQLSREASDESDARIEHLEAALRTIYDCCDYTGNCSVVRRIARKALEGKDDVD